MASDRVRTGAIAGALAFLFVSASFFFFVLVHGLVCRRWALTTIPVREYDPEAARLPASPSVSFWPRFLLFVLGRERSGRSPWRFFCRRRSSSPSPATTAPPAAAANACSSSLGSDEAESCAVCTDDLARGDRVRRLLCGHIFHAPCIGEWLTRNAWPTCPLWRVPVVVLPRHN